MKTYIQAHGFDVCQATIDGYITPATPPTDRDGNKINENNSRATNAILNDLYHSIYVNVMHHDFAKDIWDKLQNIYEGDVKVRRPSFKPIETSLSN